MITGLLLRLLIGVLVVIIGEKVTGLVSNGDIKKILDIILIVVVVIYVVFGGPY